MWSEYEPSATNGRVLATITLAFWGVMARDCRTGGPTVNIADPLTKPYVARMLVAPCWTLLARPPAAMVATLGDDELQLTQLVISCATPLVKLATAVNCWVNPAGTVGFDGVTVIEVAAMPVPDNFTLCVPSPESSTIWRVPVRAPGVVGVNATEIVH